jgi:hypothetical protein
MSRVFWNAEGSAGNYAAMAVGRFAVRKAFRMAWETRIDVAAAVAAHAVGPYLPHSDQYRSAWRDAHRMESAKQSDLIRNIFGNPFRPVTIAPAILHWNDSTVIKLAQAIYDASAFERMAILGDALEEAGCTAADVLNHCRQPGPHTKGCWVVDLLLGKK